MSVIDEETIKEHDTLYKGKNYHMSDDLLVIAVMELIKEIRKQNELIKAIGIQVNNVDGELMSIDNTLDKIC